MSTSESLIALKVRSMLLFPAHEAIKNLIGFLVCSTLTIIPARINCMFLHASFTFGISLNLLLVSSFEISSSYTCFMDTPSSLMIALIWYTSHLLTSSLLPLQFSPPHDKKNERSTGVLFDFGFNRGIFYAPCEVQRAH